ncbi:RsiW-degrading membrane proteinase PrsW (M82 family) [Propionicimonas paludicola]|uniref:RsiW-degrading membrane proteinase PrsW (M82 family) n=1 Tax=Propionicimonas paludicola TaxID=185243 RepID=A0A2A9CNW5_9ACTN|nr:PrsW family intramembrane metalloprotease [Propionicimonas paludicola]PFG16028.1 RsiW-degrading membrane proteinase PrsW (M82 family) [Propionicimonas paludicola]
MTKSVAELARRRNGLPGTTAAPTGPLWQRVLRSGWTWLLLGATAVFVAALAAQWQLLTADIPVEGGVIEGVNASAIRTSAWLALPTLAVWTVLFLLADRYRPQRFAIWYLALGWGAAIATFLSIYANTWAGQHLSIAGDGDPASSARAAIFVAPFVEEAAKATVLFGIAILARYRLTSKVSTIVLAGLSAAGFAFTENIIYYSRVIVFSSQNIGVGDADAALSQIVLLRGVLTAFGHPLFTMMTGIGLAVALRTRSKVVRVLAPLAGYLAAAGLHMLFNSQATLADGRTQMVLYFVIALPMVLGALVYVIRQILAEGRRIRTRLGDYVQLGWLPAADQLVNAKLRTRAWALLIGITHGPRVWWATVRLQRTLTELAYLRDGQVRGLYDQAATVRARELIELAHQLRPVAIADPRGRRLNLPRLRRRQPSAYQPPNYPGPAGLGGNWPAPGQSSQLGSPGYSAVDPRWGPPKG